MVWTGIEVNSIDVAVCSMQFVGGEKIEERGEEAMVKKKCVAWTKSQDKEMCVDQ